MNKLAIGIAGLLLGAGAAYPAEPARVMDGSDGKVWADQNGMTLYTFEKDAAGVSKCYGMCAVAWPPLMADADSAADGDWSVVKRTNGTRMWAYDGHPLYTYVGDRAAGEINGDGKGGVWHVAKAE